MQEMVNHPKHYNKEGRKECIVEMEEKYGTEAVIHFCMLSAYKYEYRAGLKNADTVDEDLKKAVWYRNYATQLMKKEMETCKND